ncbi:MAG: hypothetical protein GXZ00_05660 [Synergistaceae bacterium]|nr:hypothetical protein [Synergistaceae bacterium]
MKKTTIIILALIFSVLTAAGALAQNIGALTEIDGWINGELRETEFDTVSGKRGFWLERDYRNNVGVPFHAVWMEGSGDKGWTPSEKTISADDGLLGTGAVYKTISIKDDKALIEHHPILGYSLSVKVGKKGTLTLESNIANEEEMISAAEILVNKIK